nr:MAG TPA: hypothetical protein [Caudoviricetes sp.]
MGLAKAYPCPNYRLIGLNSLSPYSINGLQYTGI